MDREVFFWRHRALWLTGLLAIAGCRGGSPFVSSSQVDPPDAATPADGASVPDTPSIEPDAGAVDSATPDVPGPLDVEPGLDPGATPDTRQTGLAPVVIGTWNLHNFSKYGVDEFRLDDLAGKITELDADVLAVQELKVCEDPYCDGPQAWEQLLLDLPAYDGVNAPWDPNDTTVGLAWKTATTTVHDQFVIYESDWSAFPRPPLVADLTVARDGGETHFTVIVLHLKAFKDSVDRRRDACQKLVKYVQDNPTEGYVIIGDLNDDPYDPPADNSFTGTFLDAEPAWIFVTAALAPESVTSTGYYHYVDGQKITGEFLDHAIMTGPLHEAFGSVTAEIHGVPESQYDAWRYDYSDHFPVLVTLTP